MSLDLRALVKLNNRLGRENRALRMELAGERMKIERLWKLIADLTDRVNACTCRPRETT